MSQAVVEGRNWPAKAVHEPEFFLRNIHMANFNKVMLMGNITRDPELKYLPSNTAVAEFGMAINRSWTDAHGQKKEEVTFVDCSVFGKLAEVLGQYKKKGDPLFIEGRLKLEQWEAQDGSKRSKMKVIVEGFQFLNRGESQQGNNNRTAPRGKQQPQQDEGGYQGEDTNMGEAPF